MTAGVQSFLDSAAALLAAVARASWQACALALVVLLLHRLFGERIPARVRYNLWLLVLLRLALPVTPESRFSLYNLFGRADLALPSLDAGHAGQPPAVVAAAALPPPVVRPRELEPREEAAPPADAAPAAPTPADAPPAVPAPADGPLLAHLSTDERPPAASGGTTPAAAAEPPVAPPAELPADLPVQLAEAAPHIASQPIPLMPRSTAMDPAGPHLARRAFRAAAAVWLAGVLLLLGRVLLASFRLSRSVRRARVVQNPVVAAVAHECARDLGLRRPPAILVGEDVPSPALVGLLRPRLLLPPDVLRTLSRRELRLVLLHEMSHLRRRDVLTNWVLTSLQVLHWFNPLVRLIAARVRADRELACDEAVLAVAGRQDRSAYGHTLLKLLDALGRGATPAAAAAPAAGRVGILEFCGTGGAGRWRRVAGCPGANGRRNLTRRITMIARFEQKRLGWTVLAAAVGLALGTVTLTDAVAADEKPADVKESAPSAEAAQPAGSVAPVKADGGGDDGGSAREEAVKAEDPAAGKAGKAAGRRSAEPLRVNDSVIVSLKDPLGSDLRVSAIRKDGHIALPRLSKKVKALGETEQDLLHAIAAAYAEEKHLSPEAAKEALDLTVDRRTGDAFAATEAPAAAKLDRGPRRLTPSAAAPSAAAPSAAAPVAPVAPVAPGAPAAAPAHPTPAYLPGAAMPGAVPGMAAFVQPQAMGAAPAPVPGPYSAPGLPPVQPPPGYGAMPGGSPMVAPGGFPGAPGTATIAGSLGRSRGDAERDALLARKLPEVNFAQSSLVDLIDFLRDVSNANLVVDWRALESAGVQRDTKVSLRLRDVSFRKALETSLFLASGDTELLDYQAEEGVILISTAQKLKRAREGGARTASPASATNPYGNSAPPPATDSYAPARRTTPMPGAGSRRGGDSDPAAEPQPKFNRPGVESDAAPAERRRGASGRGGSSGSGRSVAPGAAPIEVPGTDGPGRR